MSRCCVSCISFNKFLSAVIIWVKMFMWFTVQYVGLQQAEPIYHKTRRWRKLFLFIACHNVAARWVGDTACRTNYRSSKEKQWAPVRESLRPAPFSIALSRTSVTERTAVNTQHDFNKAYDLRNQCSECQLLPKGWKTQEWKCLYNPRLCTV